MYAQCMLHRYNLQILQFANSFKRPVVNGEFMQKLIQCLPKQKMGCIHIFLFLIKKKKG